jgi:outer membrane immunogenic protein
MITPCEHGVESSAMTKSVCAAACALAMLGLAHNALPADLPYLRGSQVFEPQPATYDRWSGLYFGVQGGYAHAQMDFTRAAESIIHHILRESDLENVGQVSGWQLLGTANHRDISWGGFIGYNSQFENVILGVEANYNRTSLSAISQGRLERIVPVGPTYDTTLTAAASMKITDYGSVRARAGWVAGRFMPYLMGGLALGRVETRRSATVDAAWTDQNTGQVFHFSPPTEGEIRSVYPYGYMAGAGIDIALLQNVFVRGEVEWLQFVNLPDMQAQIVTGRLAAGLKF